jgi:flagellar basal body rod protein FlgG
MAQSRANSRSSTSSLGRKSTARETHTIRRLSSETPSLDSTVQQGALENSNVNPVASVVELITAQRAAEMSQRALTMFNSEMDKTASQDLPKVG